MIRTTILIIVDRPGDVILEEEDKYDLEEMVSHISQARIAYSGVEILPSK